MDSSCEAKLTEAKIKLLEMEKEQLHAAEIEDFDAADALNTTIEGLKKEITSINFKLSDYKSSIINLELQKQTNRAKEVI